MLSLIKLSTYSQFEKAQKKINQVLETYKTKKYPKFYKK